MKLNIHGETSKKLNLIIFSHKLKGQKTEKLTWLKAGKKTQPFKNSVIQ